SIFSKETITWVDGLSPCFQSNVNDTIYIKIGPDRLTFLSDPICFICLLAMNRVSIFIREDSDGFCSECVACAERTDSNLAAIGNQNFFKHWCVSVALS